MPLEDEDHTADLWEDPSQGGALGRILEASETGDVSVLAVALPSLSVSVDSTGPDGDTALHLAALYGHAQCVQMLLGAGANVAVRDADGGTPLHDACAGGFEAIVGMLLAAAGPAGASEVANARDGDDETPLHMAARGGYPGIVRMLLAAGAKADTKSAAGLFPWNYAEDGSELHAMLPRCE